MLGIVLFPIRDEIFPREQANGLWRCELEHEMTQNNKQRSEESGSEGPWQQRRFYNAFAVVARIVLAKVADLTRLRTKLVDQLGSAQTR